MDGEQHCYEIPCKATCVNQGNESHLIGLTALYGIDWTRRTAYTGTIIGDTRCWGKSLGACARMLLLDFAFNRLKLAEVTARVSAKNTRCLKSLNKCGYIVVGRSENKLTCLNGSRDDELLLLLTSSKWHVMSKISW